jgi:hypothetical protein
MKKKRYLFFISQDYSFPVLRPLQQKILERGDEVKWFLYGDEITVDYLKSEEERLFSVCEVVDFNPDAVFVPGNVVPSFIPGLKVEIFHGLPSTKAKKNGQLYHYIIRGMFDLYCTQGSSSTSRFKELSNKHGYFYVQETGWCKLDPLFWINQNESVSNKKTIFLASTFSPRFSKAKVLYPLVLKMMQKYDFNWFVTLHPKMDKDIVALYKSINLKNVKFVNQSEIIESFKKSDMMLCDTSSIIYEFLIQLKPVVTFQTQKDEPHLINVEDLNRLEETILSVLNGDIDNSENIKKSVKEFHPYRDGKSSQRVLDVVEDMLEGKNRPAKKKPLNLIRNFKLRRELNYWKI